MRPAIPLLALLAALVAAPAGAQTAGAEPAEAAAVQSGVEAAPGMEAAPQSSSGLPMRDTQARTMRAYWHVFIAFAATWLLLFGYALTMGRRFGRLEEEVRRLRESEST